MRFSFWPGSGQPWPEILAASKHAAATGWDGVWFADHFMPFQGDIGEPIHECWTVLAGLAAAVPLVRLGSIVTGNTYRNPAVLAKQVATVDHISGGRVILGLGAGVAGERARRLWHRATRRRGDASTASTRPAR